MHPIYESPDKDKNKKMRVRVCARCATDQLCSRREGAALLTDPFKGSMVERAVKVGQENT